MRIPSAKLIEERLDWLDKVGDPTELARQAHRILEEHLDNQKYPVFGFNISRKIQECFEELNKLLECHGVEYIFHKDDGEVMLRNDCKGLEYLNTGDTYTTTIIYNYKTGTIQLTSVGDIVEKHMNWYP